MASNLLPSNATGWERSVADAMTVSTAVGSAINSMRRAKYVSPRSSMLPHLVYEYGLGELTPYVPNLYELIDQGVRWQRLRGTASAVAIGLAWVGYSATIEEAWAGRRWWNSFQLRFSALPVADTPDLDRIEGITTLSVPLRSHLRRGVHQYDVGALEADHSVLDGAMLDFESGIAVTPKGTVWSFGRKHEFEHRLTQVEGEQIGNWLDPVDDEPLLWAAMDVPWVDAEFLWSDDPADQRRAILAGWFRNHPLYLQFSDAAGVIGYRLCRAVRPVHTFFDGAYSHGSSRYHPRSSGGVLYVEAMTQFGDVAGRTAASVALAVGGTLAAGVKPGRQWLSPDEYIGGRVIAAKSANIELRPTVRDQVKFLVRF